MTRGNSHAELLPDRQAGVSASVEQIPNQVALYAMSKMALKATAPTALIRYDSSKLR
jgi:hypothetical protein